MEQIKGVTEKVTNMPEQKKKSNYDIQRVWCVTCGVEFDREYKYPDPVSSQTICSLECFRVFKEKEFLEIYNREILGVPIKYRDIKYEPKDIEQYFRKNLFITGESGVGKTVLASSIAKECIKARIPYKWIGYSQFILELQSLYKSNRENPFDKAEEISNFNGVLIIDDLGSEKMTEYVRQITYFIINEREQRELPLVITSNFTLEEIASQIDVRIASRILGMCKAIKLSGKDRRNDEQNKEWKKGEAKLNYKGRLP